MATTPVIPTGLVIEDGSKIPYANSYVTLVEAHAYAKLRGKDDTFSDDDLLTSYLIRAVDYLETATYAGDAMFSDQVLSWPRSNAYLNNFLLPDDAIPTLLKSAQIEVALVIASGIDVLPTVDGASAKFVTKEKVGPIETNYSKGTVDPGYVSMAYVDYLLARLSGSIGGGLRINRV